MAHDVNQFVVPDFARGEGWLTVDGLRCCTTSALVGECNPDTLLIVLRGQRRDVRALAWVLDELAGRWPRWTVVRHHAGQLFAVPAPADDDDRGPDGPSADRER